MTQSVDFLPGWEALNCLPGKSMDAPPGRKKKRSTHPLYHFQIESLINSREFLLGISGQKGKPNCLDKDCFLCSLAGCFPLLSITACQAPISACNFSTEQSRCCCQAGHTCKQEHRDNWCISQSEFQTILASLTNAHKTTS